MIRPLFLCTHVQLRKEWLVKLLIAFGAKTDISNKDCFLPVDLVLSDSSAMECHTETALATLLTGLAPRVSKIIH